MLTSACWHGHLEIVLLMLKDGRFHPYIRPLLTAAEMGHYTIVKAMIQDPRIDTNACQEVLFIVNDPIIEKILQRRLHFLDSFERQGSLVHQV